MFSASSQPAETEAAPAVVQSRSWTEPAAVIIRCLLGVVFVTMGMQKILHPVEFLKLVRDYDLILGPPWLNLIAGLLPWFEFFCGLLLLAGIAVRGVVLNLLLMLVPFSLVILRRALDLTRTNEKGTS